MKRLWPLAIAAALAVPVYGQNITTKKATGADDDCPVVCPAPGHIGGVGFGHFGPPPPPPFPGGGPEMFGGPMPFPMMMHDLPDLTDAQVEEMVQQKRDMLTNDAPKRLKIEQLHFDMEDALCQPTIDKAKVMDLSSRISALRSELATSETERRVKMVEALTPEQRKKMRRALLAPPPPMTPFPPMGVRMLSRGPHVLHTQHLPHGGGAESGHGPAKAQPPKQ